MTDDREPWTRSARVAFGVLVGLLLASLALTVHPWFDRTHDGALYVHTARALAAGEGYSWLGMPFRVRPPGFSALIAPLVGASGAIDFWRLNLVAGAFGVAAAALLFVHARARVGWPLALVAAVALWATPTWQRFASQVMSDVPGTALLLGCLVLERRAARRPSLARDVVLGLAIGATAWVRFVAVLLVPAVWLARVLGQRGGADRRPWAVRLLPVALAAGAAIAPWQVRNALVTVPTPTDQTLNYSYATGLLRADEGDPESRLLAPAEILARVPQRGADIVGTLGSRLATREPDLVRTLVAALFLAALARAAWKRRAAAELFCGLVLALVSVYFAFDERLVLPVYALALPALLEALRDAAGVVLPRRAAGAMAGAALLALCAHDWRPRAGWDGIEREHAAFGAFAEAVDARLAPDARLAAGYGWQAGLYLDRPVYSLRFAVRRAGRPAGAEAVIERERIDALVLYRGLVADRALFPWAVERYGPGAVEAIDDLGAIVRVR